MAAEDFPTLSRGPRFETFKESPASDPTIRTQPEDGDVMSRSRTTALKRRFEFEYDQLTDADHTLLEDFKTTVMIGSVIFNWTHEKTDEAIECRLLYPGIDMGIDPGNSTLWIAKVILEEA